MVEQGISARARKPKQEKQLKNIIIYLEAPSLLFIKNINKIYRQCTKALHQLSYTMDGCKIPNRGTSHTCRQPKWLY